MTAALVGISDLVSIADTGSVIEPWLAVILFWVFGGGLVLLAIWWVVLQVAEARARERREARAAWVWWPVARRGGDGRDDRQ